MLSFNIIHDSQYDYLFRCIFCELSQFLFKKVRVFRGLWKYTYGGGAGEDSLHDEGGEVKASGDWSSKLEKSTNEDSESENIFSSQFLGPYPSREYSHRVAPIEGAQD